MAAVFERTFKIRHYECDAYGHVNHANYLRYMQETAFDASAAVGYSVHRYEEMGRTWLVHETDIKYLRPLTYGDSVIVKTWVLDIRRFRSRRVYEMRNTSTGEIVAEALTHWAFLDSYSLRPLVVPREMIDAYLPDGPPAEVPSREPIPPAPSPPPGVFTMKRRVEWRDIDMLQHVNNTNYMAYFEDCSVQVARAYGWPMARIMETGFGIIARRYRIEYKEPARLDEELEVATWLSNVKRTTAVRHYTITRISDGSLLARARALWVWLNLETGRPMRIPAGFIDDFAHNISRV